METIIQDLKFGVRSLWKSPGFAVVSTVTLALAIGVNTSVFSLVSVLVFADLPFQDSESIALIRGTNAELGVDLGSVSPGDYMELVDRVSSFESMSALTEAQWIMTDGDAPVRIEGLQTTAGLTEEWRLPPVLGRSFAEGEDRFGAPQVAMLSYGFWQRQFGGRSDVLGETLRLDGSEFSIIGVMNPKLEFASFANAQVITPLILNRTAPNRSARYLFVTGRLAPGASQSAATEEVRRIGEQLAEEYPVDNMGWGLWSAPGKESLINDEANTILLLLQLTVGMVILIACANVANMLLARSTARAREIAVRTALGAKRGRLVRQLLTESVLISLAAAGLGIGLAMALNEALIWISAGTEEIFLMAEFNGPVLAFTLAIALLAPLAFGLFPALRASTSGPQDALRGSRSGDGARSGKRVRSVLVVAQISLALTLMIVSTLMTRSVINLQSRTLGYDPEGLLTLSISLPESKYEEPDERRIFFAQAQDAVQQATGSSRVELTNVLPGAGSGARRSIVIDGREVIEGRTPPSVFMVTVSDGFFDLIGLPIESGRGFAPADDPQSFDVAVLSRAVANRHWPDEDPIGKRFQVSGTDSWVQVIGIVADVQNQNDPADGSPNIYLPYKQSAKASMFMVARTGTSAAALAGPLRAAMAGVDPMLPVDAIRTMKRAQYEAGASAIALVTLFATFAFFALLMSVVGIYGVMAYSVSQRKNEIGLRMALGAEGGEVRWMILGQGTRLLGIGLAIGLVAAFGLSRLLGSIVFGISATDPLTFIGVPIVFAAVAMLATMLPARRATRLDPAITLRAD